MRIFSRPREKRYCAFCKSPRKVYLKKHVGLTNVVAAGLLAATVTAAIWGTFEPKGLVIFCMIIGASEFLVYLRWRLAVVCRMCGFDPVVYKQSPERAAQMVRQFFTEQVKNPRFQLSQSPLLELHRRQKELERKKARLRTSLGPRRPPVVDPNSP